MSVDSVRDRVATGESHLSDLAGTAEGEHAVHENGEPLEPLQPFGGLPAVVNVVIEVEHLEMLPEVEPHAREDARGHAGFGREEGQDVEQQ